MRDGDLEARMVEAAAAIIRRQVARLDAAAALETITNKSGEPERSRRAAMQHAEARRFEALAADVAALAPAAGAPPRS